jgi:hypothetical protein
MNSGVDAWRRGAQPGFEVRGDLDINRGTYFALSRSSHDHILLDAT